jgi:hypothetical protein
MKGDWRERSEEFGQPLAITSEQSKACHEWCAAHRSTNDPAPQEEELRRMMMAMLM